MDTTRDARTRNAKRAELPADAHVTPGPAGDLVLLPSPFTNVRQLEQTGAVIPIGCTDRERQATFGIGRNRAGVVGLLCGPLHVGLSYGFSIYPSSPETLSRSPRPDEVVVS